MKITISGETIEKALLEATRYKSCELSFLRSILFYLTDGMSYNQALLEAKKSINIDSINN